MTHEGEQPKPYTAGPPPDPADLDQITSIVDPRRFIDIAWPVMAAAAAWFTICAILIAVQIKVLLWSATHHPRTDPSLAKWAFYITAGSVVPLVTEGLIRISVQGLSRMAKTLSELEPASEEERTALYTAITRHTRDSRSSNL
ncbi:hypothetical protein ACFVTC_20925 [Streptomyces sp. NPDC057950]|uniref:hypothetical protein n=1 Tax=Streptomyces sp. NPDC057950 TaxID=3346288 RepID=UPI0036EF12EE